MKKNSSPQRRVGEGERKGRLDLLDRKAAPRGAAARPETQKDRRGSSWRNDFELEGGRVRDQEKKKKTGPDPLPRKEKGIPTGTGGKTNRRALEKTERFLERSGPGKKKGGSHSDGVGEENRTNSGGKKEKERLRHLDKKETGTGVPIFWGLECLQKETLRVRMLGKLTRDREQKRQLVYGEGRKCVPTLVQRSAHRLRNALPVDI